MSRARTERRGHLKSIADCLKTTITRGLFVLLPLLLLEMLLVEVFQLMAAVATPIANLLPNSWIAAANAPVLRVVALILLASFVLGVASKS